MLTKRLTQANKEISSLIDFLVKRDWSDSRRLLKILERADNEVNQIVERAINDVLKDLQESYSKEAEWWSKNKMTDLNGRHIDISVKEQRKAQTELNRINKSIKKLNEI